MKAAVLDDLNEGDESLDSDAVVEEVIRTAWAAALTGPASTAVSGDSSRSQMPESDLAGHKPFRRSVSSPGPYARAIQPLSESDYSILWTEEDERGKASERSDNFEQSLRSLGARVNSHLSGYGAVRGDWLNTQFGMNEQQLVAPLYRMPRLAPPWRPTTKEQQLFALDRQIVDLHWLHCSGCRRTLRQHEFACLLADDTFDWKMAESFALSAVKTSTKAGQWLGLSELEEWQLSCMHGDAVRKKLGDLLKARSAVEVKMRTATGCKVDDEYEIRRGAAMWWVESAVPGATAGGKALLFARILGLSSVPKPAVFQRQLKAKKRAWEKW